MKNIFVVSTIAIFAAGAAVAGSLEPVAVETAPYAIPASIATDWSGFYVGGLAGIQNGDLISNPGTPGAIVTPIDVTNYGGFAGYNFQQGSIVYGAEIAAQMGNVTVGGINGNLDYLVDARARVGYAFDSVLVYAAGGYSAGQVSNLGVSETFSGFNVGAGLELAVTDNFFLGGEYIYRDMSGTTTVGLIPFDIKTHGVQVRAGFRF